MSERGVGGDEHQPVSPHGGQPGRRAAGVGAPGERSLVVDAEVDAAVLRTPVTPPVDALLEITPQVPIQALAERAQDDGGVVSPVDSTAVEAPPRSDAVPSQIGRFTVLQRLGSGGMGVVYAAYDPDLDRRVAVKVLHTTVTQTSTGATARARLLREAKALAKLSHPNVVAVYDVGTLNDDQVFIAMEFVKGLTLTKWIRSPEPGPDGTTPDKRPWREVLGVFLQAGRGLAAAHKAGIIHRDFKPDNVLIGQDGRVRVVDFGLARAEGTTPNRPDTFAEAIKSLTSQSSSVFDLQLTRTGGLAGTPAYMAPEQYAKLLVDARTDQFSFCVALYEGLYGKRPFVGDTVARVRKAVIAGEVADEPPGSGVPSWLRRILLRGLQVHPGARYPSMDALLADLSDDPVRPTWPVRTVGALAAGALSIALLAYALFVRPSDGLGDAAACYANLATIDGEDGVYGARRRESLRRAYASIAVPGASATWGRVDELLTDYTREWRRIQRGLCTLSRYQGERPSDFVRLQQGCLDRRRGAMGALIERLAAPSPSVVVAAVPAVMDLLGSAPCSDPSSLRARVDEPEDAGVVEVGANLRGQLDEVLARHLLGQDGEALELVRNATTEAASLDHIPVRAEAFELRGALELELGLHDDAERSLKEALWNAEVCHHDEVAAESLALLVRVLGVYLGRHEEASLLAPRLTAAIRRLGDRRREVGALQGLGRAEAGAGNFEAALVRLQSARDVAGKIEGASGKVLLAGALLDLGAVLRETRRLDEAVIEEQRAAELLEGVFGVDHPEVAAASLKLCETWLRSGDLSRARRPCRRALEIHEVAESSPHLRGRARFAVARFQWQAGEIAEAQRMAAEAQAELVDAGSVGARDLEAVRAWLSEHGR